MLSWTGAFALGLGAAALGMPQGSMSPTTWMPAPAASAVDAAETLAPGKQPTPTDPLLPQTDPLLPQNEQPENFEQTERQDAEARHLIDETSDRAKHPPPAPYHRETGNATWQPQFTIRDGRVQVSPVDPAASNNSDKVLNPVPPAMGTSVDYPFERDPTMKTF